MVAVPELREIINRFGAIEARAAPWKTAPARPPAAHPRVNIKQRTVRLSQPLIETLKEQATTEGKEPSHLVEELLWQALNDRQASSL